MDERSPSWYRLRGAIFGAIYLLGFYGGSWIWSLAGHAYVPAYVWFGARFGPSGPQVVLAVATVCVFCCWALRAWGSAYLRYGVVWGLNAQTNALVVDGPYAHLRHPLYLGNLFLAAGIGALATPFGFAFIVAASLVLVTMLTVEEAHAMRAAFGARFDAYRAAVPALMPRLRPAHVPGSVAGVPSLAQGLRSEIMVASLAIGMLLVLVAGERMFFAVVALWLFGWIAQLAATAERDPQAPREPASTRRE